ncbi:hypothetical protein EKO04_006983 [Ascochyta lentis]|uniref:Cytochrome P450 n=1 Tax=Ascochyta lentis TaxID=205686 RepID=A0A8H7J2N7_9PLEO|nr:hypothetical protein EKO04_006983 [Ascochyta lentis]
MRLPGQDMHLIHPLNTLSIKRFTGMQTLSLMTVFRVAVGPAMSLVPASEKFLTDPDTGVSKRELSKLFNEQLRSLKNLSGYAAQLQSKIDKHWAESVSLDSEHVEMGLASWVFDTLSYSMGAVFWGEKGPFEDALFREQLRVFIQNLEALRNPVTFLVPRHLRSARAYVRESLDQAAVNNAYGLESQGRTLFNRLAALYEAHGVPPAGFTDCHLVAIVGLLSNVINIMAWAMCHIAGDEKLKASLMVELNAVVEKSHSRSSSDNVLSEDQGLELLLEINQVRESCPLLLATWYELLRTYGDSPVARYVNQDSAFDAQYQVKKGSIIMTPIHLHNCKDDIWGQDADAFRPSRFLSGNSSKVDADLIKHLEVFGLPGMHQCPGRYLAMNLVVALVAKMLLSFEITPVPGGTFSIPKRKETMLGLPATGSDPKVLVRHRQGIRSVHVGFENVRPGW